MLTPVVARPSLAETLRITTGKKGSGPPWHLLVRWKHRIVIEDDDCVAVHDGNAAVRVRTKQTPHQEAWESLAANGVIPVDAVQDPLRMFVGHRHCPRPSRRPVHIDEGWCPWCDDAGVVASIHDHPTSLAALVAIASAWPTIITAEAIAFEAAALLTSSARRVVWKVSDRCRWGLTGTMPIWQAQRLHARDIPAALANLGVAMDSITADTVVMAMPLVGALDT